MLGAARSDLIEMVLSPRAVDMVDRRSAGVWRRRKSPCYGRFMRDEMWKTVHAELTRLARAKGEYDAEEAHWLVAAVRLRVHEQVGYATALEYLERLFGYGPRMAKERLRVAEALAGLPAMRDALAAGGLTWSAVRELSRVAQAGTEAEWLAAARGKTARQIEEMVPGRKPGDRPSDPAEPVTRHVLRLELSAEALAAFREARRQIELEVGHSLDDDAAVRMLAHYALRGPDDPGRARRLPGRADRVRGVRPGDSRRLRAGARGRAASHRSRAVRCAGVLADPRGFDG